MARPNTRTLVHPKHEEIEAEYGEPIYDVIKGFAEMGYGKRTVARILGYSSESAFRRLLKRREAQGWEIPWKPYGEQVISQQRQPHTAATRAKIRAAVKDKYTPEVREKIRQAALRREAMKRGELRCQPRI